MSALSINVSSRPYAELPSDDDPSQQQHRHQSGDEEEEKIDQSNPPLQGEEKMKKESNPDFPRPIQEELSIVKEENMMIDPLYSPSLLKEALTEDEGGAGNQGQPSTPESSKIAHRPVTFRSTNPSSATTTTRVTPAPPGPDSPNETTTGEKMATAAESDRDPALAAPANDPSSMYLREFLTWTAPVRKALEQDVRVQAVLLVILTWWISRTLSSSPRIIPGTASSSSGSVLQPAASHSSPKPTTSIGGFFISMFLWFWIHVILLPLWRLLTWAVGVTLGVGLGLGLATHVHDQLEAWRVVQEAAELDRRGRGPAAEGYYPLIEASASSPQNKLANTMTLTSSTVQINTSFPPSLATASSSTAMNASFYRAPRPGMGTMGMSMRQSSQGAAAASAAALNLSADEQNSYASLMQSAGYNCHDKVLRGQVLRKQPPNQAPFWQQSPNYAYNHVASRSQQRAVLLMQQWWPTLPTAIQVSLGSFIELILRDYVASWFSMVDAGCPYQNEKDYRQKQQQPPAAATNTPESSPEATPTRAMVYQVAGYRRVPFVENLYEAMVILFGNLATRVEHVNFLELILLHWTHILARTFQVYRTLRKSVMIKLLAHEHARKSSQVLGSAAAASSATAGSGLSASSKPPSRRGPFRGSQTSNSLGSSISPGHSVKANLDTGAGSTPATAGTTAPGNGPGAGGPNPRPSTVSNTSTPTDVVKVTEIAMTKEFLFSGKLHKAITFGLDVPSLLFADANGRECGRPTSPRTSDGEDKASSDTGQDLLQPGQSSMAEEDQVLADRLFNTKILYECELDYNRVVGYRMVRALIPRTDFGSPIVSSFLTEVMGGCVLTPLMSCFCPAYLNSWIIQGLDDSSTETTNGDNKESAADATATESAEKTSTVGAVGEEKKDGAVDDNGRDHTADAQSLDSSNIPSPLPSPVKSAIKEASLGGPGMLVALTGSLTVAAGDERRGLLESPAEKLAPQPQAKLPTISEDSETGENIITLLAMALIDLQRFIDFEECRQARESRQEVRVDWDDSDCRAAVLRLVLVIEAALTHGRCTYKVQETEPSEADLFNEDLDEEMDGADAIDESLRPVEVTLPEYESATLSQILMEMTGDIEAFEERVATENTLNAIQSSKYDEMFAEEYKPTSREQSTLRTLIAAWLHTGQIYRTVTVLVQAHTTVLAPYYNKKAFLRTKENASGFVRQLKALDGVDILVDTMTVLASPRLDEATGEELVQLVRRSTTQNQVHLRTQQDSDVPTPIIKAQLMLSSSTPRYLDFHRNEAFAASLRSERERRSLSWQTIVEEDLEDVSTVYRAKGGSQEDLLWHRELHHLARIFYTGTNLIGIQGASRRKAQCDSEGVSQDDPDADTVPVSLLTVETACPRRRIEVPDDDSSFLLRAQPRALNAVAVHRDQRSHDQSYKCYAATYDEPALSSGSEHYSGGRYVRRCLVRYYPIDRTAAVTIQHDIRKLDQRKGASSIPDMITVGQASRTAPFLSAEFLRDRFLCQRWIPKGTARSQSILASSVMEPSDFTLMPRSGKAIDFVYRMTFFEKPMIDLSGKHFTIHDSASMGVHRADASTLELSDASLSIAMLMLSKNESGSPESSVRTHGGVEMGEDGYPVVWMKFSRKQDAQVEVKPYRISFIRAALLVTAARQEAQLKCLIKCVKAGSAKKATKALTDAQLKPTLKLLEYAGNRSREMQSLLLRDLKLGVNHIDREQLRRNALVVPRYPTSLLELTATVDDSVQAADVSDADLFGGTGTLFKVRCVAIVELLVGEEELEGDESYRAPDGSVARKFREEWVVYRSYKDFQALHKHLKAQVSSFESSGSAGSRLVGAATAAFGTSGTVLGRPPRHRNSLVPSLAQASKAGALGVTRKSILKRQEILNGYLSYLLMPTHLLNRCPELLLFIGAFFPLHPDVRVGRLISGVRDPLGRAQMSRTPLHEQENVEQQESFEKNARLQEGLNASSDSTGGGEGDDDAFDEDAEDKESPRRSRRNIDMIPSIRNKIDRVPLPQVRNRIFELLRYQFGFENASFIRNRMLAALKTASFAVTSSTEFRRTLYKVHTDHLSADSIARWIDFVSELLWPGGVFFESSPPTSQESLNEQAAAAREILHRTFPEQLRAILGQDLTRDGLDIFHEMIQNRVVMKSMAYMLFDLLWVEVFPEIGDVLECGAALDIEK